MDNILSIIVCQVSILSLPKADYSMAVYEKIKRGREITPPKIKDKGLCPLYGKLSEQEPC